MRTTRIPADSTRSALQDAVARLILDPSLPDCEPEAVDCEMCRGAGFLRADVFPGHPDFGKPFPCPACAPRRRSDRIGHLLERLWGNDEDAWLHFKDATLETYPWSFETKALRPLLERWIIDDPHWLLLWGPVRRGKTGLAISLIRQLVERGQPGILTTAPKVLDRIKATYRDGSDEAESDILESLIASPVLLIDDLGAEQPSGWVAEKFYTIINGRLLGHRRTIITTNLDPEEALERAGQRVMWRVWEMCGEYMLKVDGPNLSARRRA